ncbi:MAG TPA: hypothetical protein VNE39_17005 [Planctomycetota bacterium]|nr:hypothetical protein [Planctomycetota bacterium]
MSKRLLARGGGAAIVLALGLALLAGCSHPASVGDYFAHRGNDLAQIVDLGVTWSSKPYGSVYACLLGFSSIGVGHVDGHFAGLGGGKVGVFRHYHKVCGLLLWTYEELGWREFDITKPETLYRWHNGPIGYVKYFERKPAYCPS